MHTYTSIAKRTQGQGIASIPRPGNGTPGTGYGNDATHRKGPGRAGYRGANAKNGRPAIDHGSRPEKTKVAGLLAALVTGLLILNAEFLRWQQKLKYTAAPPSASKKLAVDISTSTLTRASSSPK